MLHIVQTVASLRASKGGVSRTVAQLSGALAGQPNTHVSIVSADRNADGDIAALRVQGAPSGLNILAPGRTFANVQRLAKRSAATTPLVHDNGLWRPSNLMAAIAARSRRVPLVISPHGMLEQWALGHKPMRKRAALATYQQWCLKTAVAFHATSAVEAENVRRLGFRQPIAVVGNGVESPPKNFSLTPNGTRTALFLSRLHPKKGVLELIAAWDQVRPSGWRLRIVGPDEGGYREKIAAAIARSGVAGSIDLFDGANDAQKWRHYAQAELFILPTFSENFGLVIAEALACGIPVITTNATPWHAIEDQGCGWVIDPTVGAIVAALSAATSLPPEVLRQMGAEGRIWIPQEYSWDKIARKMHELYTWIVGGCAPKERPAFVQLS
jgi:glycosyltransferase involved in cell wall biosynthesis